MHPSTAATLAMSGAFATRCRRRPTLPRPLDRSTIGAVGLNDRVRDGNGCGPYALVASESLALCALNVNARSVNDRRRVVVIVIDLVSRSRVLCSAIARMTRTYGSSQAARAIRTAALGVLAALSTGGLSTWWSPTALQESSRLSGGFILGRASHLDAFSGYHSRSSLPGGALGRTAGTRADRPTRSSRTRVRTPQPSNAHDGYRPNCLTTF